MEEPASFIRWNGSPAKNEAGCATCFRNGVSEEPMTFSPRFTNTHAITAALARIERARGFLDAAKLSEEWISKTQKRALLLEAHHTTHIEGTQLTLRQSERILAGRKVAGARPEDAQELLNYTKAFELVADYLEAGDPITEGLIREIHKRLVEGVRGNRASPGEYRRIQNYIVNSATGERIYHSSPTARSSPDDDRACNLAATEDTP